MTYWRACPSAAPASLFRVDAPSGTRATRRRARGRPRGWRIIEEPPASADRPRQTVDRGTRDRRSAAAPRAGGTAGPSSVSRLRLDQVMVDRGLAESRAKAQALVLAGQVFSGERRLDKPGRTVAPDVPIEVRAPAVPYVSRGGLKLAAALDQFAIDPAGLVTLDLGASTGGFTDVLLRRGAARVYAVDVGHGQLDWRLRNDPRVVVLEKVNARHLSRAHLAEPVDLVVCDVSFISLELALPAALALAGPDALLIALIKPQFEVGKGQVGRGGVVRDPTLHQAVCGRISRWLAAQPGWHVQGVIESPITGPKGNREFLIAARSRSALAKEAGSV
jgi:23S rRNA (cytidine1920-2'-O)/16S rRNA (cytidine1409-2'-O)-methyltransferase